MDKYLKELEAYEQTPAIRAAIDLMRAAPPKDEAAEILKDKTESAVQWLRDPALVRELLNTLEMYDGYGTAAKELVRLLSKQASVLSSSWLELENENLKKNIAALEAQLCKKS